MTLTDYHFAKSIGGRELVFQNLFPFIAR